MLPKENGTYVILTQTEGLIIAKGIPADEIAYIHDAKTEKQKSELFDKVRNGEIRVLLGSTNSAPYEHTKMPVLRRLQTPKLTSISSLLCEI